MGESKRLGLLDSVGICLDQDCKQKPESILFDGEFYLSKYGDIARTDWDPLNHFLRHGAKEGRSPHPLFDSDYYRSSAPADEKIGDSPVLHFLVQGHQKGLNPHPLFDIAYYRQQACQLPNEQNPLLHFLNVGYREGLNPHPLFDMAYYRQQAGEILGSNENPLVHFLAHGTNLKLNPHPLFDIGFYLNNNANVKESKLNPLVHFLQHGAKDRRSPHPLFDSNYYLSVVSIGEITDDNSLLHFLKEGYRKGFSPHPLFDIDYYRNQAGELLGNENPLLHFLDHGVRLQLNPHPLFDLSFYLSNNLDARENRLNPLVHFLLYGKERQLSPHPFFDSRFYLSRYPDVEKSWWNPLVHFVNWGAQEHRRPNADFDSSISVRLLCPVSVKDPLFHYFEAEEALRFPAKGLGWLDYQYIVEFLQQVCRALLLFCLVLVYGFERGRIAQAKNYDHQMSLFKFWFIVNTRFWQGHGKQVKLTAPTYLMQPARFAQPQSHAKRLPIMPLKLAYLYLANVLKVQGFFADAEFILNQLSEHRKVSDLALCSLGDLVLMQAIWASEFKNYEMEGIALNPFAHSKTCGNSQTWHERTFAEALALLEQSLKANETSADAQWLLAYGQIAAGKCSQAMQTLDKYPGNSDEVAERNFLKVRAAFGLNSGDEAGYRQFLGNWSEKSKIGCLKLIASTNLPLSVRQEHIKVIDRVELPIQSIVVRNRQAVAFRSILKFDSCNLSRFKKATVIPEYGMIVVGNEMLIKDSAHIKSCHMSIFNSCLKQITDDSALICAPDSIVFEEENCIYIGSNSNYYHWLLEDLPRLDVIRRAGLFDEAPILIEKNAAQWQRELMHLLGIEETRLRAVDFKQPVEFKNLIVPSRLSRDMVAHPVAVSFLRKNLLGTLNDRKPKSGKRIYAARNSKIARGMLNERNIIDKFRRADFQIVDTGEMTIKEQIELFGDAEVIAGPGGAALTNILFGPKGARVLCLGSSHMLCQTFTSLAVAIGQESWLCTGMSYARAYPNWICTNFDFEIDERDIDFCFERIL